MPAHGVRGVIFFIELVRQIIFIVIAASVFFGFVLLARLTDTGPSKEKGTEKKLSVVATFYPLEDFARSVGGERVSVMSIVPAGVESHEYEPTPQNILAAYQADVFLLNGAGFDAWAEKIRPDLLAHGVLVLQMSDYVTLLSSEGHYDDANETDNGKQENDAFFDPHFWLDPKAAEREVYAIADAFGTRDPEGSSIYSAQVETYVQKLRELDQAYTTGLAACQFDFVVASHSAFSYMAQRYGFFVIPITGLSPEADVSSKRLAELVMLLRERGARHVFFETLVSPKVAETLAREVGADTLVFNPIEGLTDAERAAGKDYLAIMKENLESLKRARQCQE